MSIDQRLTELGITLPQPAAPVAAYVPAVEQAGLRGLNEGQKLSYEVQPDRRTGKSSATKLQVA